MNRREALSAVSFLLGGTIIGAEVFLSGCTSKRGVSGKLLSADQMAILDEVGETIIPATEGSPGAKAAKIGALMDVIVKDCYSKDEQSIFLAGIEKLEESCKSNYDKSFIDLSAEDKHNFLLILEKEAKEMAQEPEALPHYYQMMKQLTLWGYFTSEIGQTQALNHVAVPGRYESCMPLKQGQKAWA